MICKIWIRYNWVDSDIENKNEYNDGNINTFMNNCLFIIDNLLFIIDNLLFIIYNIFCWL